jgi:two-component system, NtrC family, nitrogen regulation sensor histidine kinase NtrY
LKKKQNILRPILLFLFFLSLAIGSEFYFLSDQFSKDSVKSFEKEFQYKEVNTQHILADVVSILKESDSLSEHQTYVKLGFLRKIFDKEEISFFILKDSVPFFWSDNIIGFDRGSNFGNEKFIKRSNCFCYQIKDSVDNFDIYGSIILKYNYKIQNNYLNSRFANNFNLPDDFEFVDRNSINSVPIENKQGKFAFAIVHKGESPCVYSKIFIPITCFIFALAFLFILIFRFKFIKNNSLLTSFFLLLFFIGVYSLMNFSHLPRSVFMLNLFSPQYFAFNSYWSSLGEFLVFAFLLLMWGIIFNKIFNLRASVKKSNVKGFIYFIISLIISALYFVFIRFLIYSLVMNSSFSFSVFNVEDLSINTIFGYMAIGFLLLSFLLVSFRIVKVFRRQVTTRDFFAILLVITFFVSLLFSFIDSSDGVWLSVFFPIIIFVGYFMDQKGFLSHQLSIVVLLVIVFTLFTEITVIQFVRLHDNKIQETMALNLSSEHDPNAELFLQEIDKDLKSDSILISILDKPFEVIEKYISKKYFGGYFRDYELQLTLCGQDQNLIVQPENILRPCVSFFNEMLQADGTALNGTNFFFMENSTGRISYIGKYKFLVPSTKLPVNIFIELNSKLLSEGIGFPELLLPQNSLGTRLRNNFSYAKYYNDELVDRGGVYDYSLHSSSFNLTSGQLGIKDFGGCQHLIYRPSADNCIVVSRSTETFYDYLISFPYIFVFFFVLALPVYYSRKGAVLLKENKKSLRSKIQYSIIGMVFTLLLVIGLGSVVYIVFQYRSNHKADLLSKINSVSIDMEGIVGSFNKLDSSDSEYLNFELIRISDIFKTDVNIYNQEGILIATSRPEVYEKGLISNMMDNSSFESMNLFSLPSYLHKENISGMNYLSAYVPLFCNTGKKIGYLNLPYFTHSNEFKKELTTFIIFFINIYLFLLLASILIAYFISAKITDPLRMIRENLSSIQLGKSSKPIQYTVDDEIGLLVSEYNHKVEELADNADLLARSERDLAWREMAKQIAHEIKNPLTPMKLSIQFLQRANPKTMVGYDEMVNRVTKTMIEQIDNLSAIATEFSNFAKIPKANNERFNLTQKLAEIVDLYKYSGECKLVSVLTGFEFIEIVADKEQFSRAMINIVKNAIQAIPDDGRVGIVKIELERVNDAVIVKIIDNGKGIPVDFKESIFVPNFTTKSSGAGLGLAITKNIVENFNGKIWFTSEVEKGTVFYVEIPVAS